MKFWLNQKARFKPLLRHWNKAFTHIWMAELCEERKLQLEQGEMHILEGLACLFLPCLNGLTSPSPGCSLFSPAVPASNCPSSPVFAGGESVPAPSCVPSHTRARTHAHTHTHTQGEHTVCELKEWGNGLLWVVAKTTRKNCSHNFQAWSISMWWWWEM